MLLLSGLINLVLSKGKKAGGLGGFWSVQGFFNIAVGLAFIIAPSTMVKIFVVFFGFVLLIMGDYAADWGNSFAFLDWLVVDLFYYCPFDADRWNIATLQSL